MKQSLELKGISFYSLKVCIERFRIDCEHLIKAGTPGQRIFLLKSRMSLINQIEKSLKIPTDIVLTKNYKRSLQFFEIEGLFILVKNQLHLLEDINYVGAMDLLSVLERKMM